MQKHQSPIKNNYKQNVNNVNNKNERKFLGNELHKYKVKDVNILFQYGSLIIL